MVTCWLPKKGYVPGEAILFCGEVDNQGGSELSATKVKLVEVNISLLMRISLIKELQLGLYTYMI